MARVCAVFFKFQRDGGQGEKEMARIVKEKGKRKELEDKGQLKTGKEDNRVG